MEELFNFDFDFDIESTIPSIVDAIELDTDFDKTLIEIEEEEIDLENYPFD